MILSYSSKNVKLLKRFWNRNAEKIVSKPYHDLNQETMELQISVDNSPLSPEIKEYFNTKLNQFYSEMTRIDNGLKNGQKPNEQLIDSLLKSLSTLKQEFQDQF